MATTGTSAAPSSAAGRTACPCGAAGLRARILGAVAAGSVLACGPAFGQSDSWTGADKRAHLALSAPFGALGAWLAGSAASPAERVLYGTMIGALPGLAKELVDLRTRGAVASYKDMAFNVAGAALGALLSDCCLVRPYTRGDRIDGVGIEYRIEF